METKPTTTPTPPTQAQMDRDSRWAKRMARRARRITRNMTANHAGMQARSERIDQAPGEIAARFAECQ